MSDKTISTNRKPSDLHVCQTEKSHLNIFITLQNLNSTAMDCLVDTETKELADFTTCLLYDEDVFRKCYIMILLPLFGVTRDRFYFKLNHWFVFSAGNEVCNKTRCRFCVTNWVSVLFVVFVTFICLIEILHRLQLMLMLIKRGNARSKGGSKCTYNFRIFQHRECLKR